MEEKQTLPKVLSISLSAWRSDSGIHTQTDLFKFWDPSRIAQIYTKADLPDTPVCDNFFRISENAVLKSVFKRRIQTGSQVYNAEQVAEQEQAAIEAELKKASVGIDAGALTVYNTKRKEKIFPVYSQLFSGRCSCCSMEPPLAAQNKLEGGAMIECDHCHRILYK